MSLLHILSEKHHQKIMSYRGNFAQNLLIVQNVSKKLSLVSNMKKRNIFDLNLYKYDAGGFVVINLNKNY